MTPGGPLLEREAELAAIRRMLDAAALGDGGTVVVEGEAGIGKSALLAAAADEAGARGFTVRTARGGELERGFAFGVARRLFGAELRSGGPLPPGAAAALGRGPWGESPFAALDGLYWLVDELAATAPLLLCVDDAHWADAETASWLVFLARRLDGVPAAVLLGRRPAPDAVDMPRAGVVTLSPALLSADACAELVRAAGVTADPQACARASGGNPFLLGELLRDVAAGGDVESAGPEGVRRSLARRLADLPPACSDVAGAVAVLGSDAELLTVAGLSGLPVTAVLDAIGELQRAALLDAELPPRFAHPLLRSAHYAGVPTGHRARAHADAARLLADHPQRAAVHLLATPPLGTAWAVDCLLAASSAALDAAALDSSVRLLERALAEDPPGHRRGAVLAALGHAERLLGRAEAAQHLREAMRLTEDLLPAAIEFGLAMGMAGRTAEGIAVLEQVLDTLADPYTDDALRLTAILLANAVNVGVGHHRIAARVRRTHELVRGRSPAAALLADVLLGYHFRQADTPLAELAGLAADARLAEPRGGDAPLGVWQIAYYSARDDLDAAQAIADHLLMAARRDGSLGAEAFLLGFRGLLHQRRGALPAAEMEGRASLDRAGLAGTALPRLAGLPYLVGTLVLKGDLAGADEVLDQHGLAAANPPRTSHGAALLGERAALRLAQNRCTEARSDAQESLSRWRERDSRGHPGAARLVLAETYRRDGDRDTARRHVAEELEIARELGLPSLTGMALGALGVIEGGQSGLAMLTEAAGSLEGSPCRLRLAGVLLDLGSALRRARRPVDAREPLGRALEIAHRCGAVPLADRAHSELLAAGARPRRPDRSGEGALTAAERRVAWLAAEGRTNREIAQELFVTRRTIETHLGAVYRKLGITSRAELPERR